MKKNDILKKKKLLKAVRRVKRMKRHHNFIVKTNEMEAAKKEVKKEIVKVMGLNPRDVR